MVIFFKDFSKNKTQPTHLPLFSLNNIIKAAGNLIAKFIIKKSFLISFKQWRRYSMCKMCNAHPKKGISVSFCAR
jgi:hypothetical protein